jgi:hypothetical protein
MPSEPGLTAKGEPVHGQPASHIRTPGRPIMVFTKPRCTGHSKRLKTSHPFSVFSLFTKLQYYEQTSPLKL